MISIYDVEGYLTDLQVVQELKIYYPFTKSFSQSTEESLLYFARLGVEDVSRTNNKNDSDGPFCNATLAFLEKAIETVKIQKPLVLALQERIDDAELELAAAVRELDEAAQVEHDDEVNVQV